MPSIYSYLNRGLEIEQIKAAMAKKESPQMIFHTTGSIKAALTSGLIKKDGQCLIITYSEEQAHKWASDIRAWLPLRSVLIYPATEWLPFEVLGRSRETTAERIKVLRTLLEDNNQIIIAPVQAIARKLFSPQHWKKYSLHIIAGKTYSLQELIKILVTAGYERQEIVEAKGQFALRGGILDIAPLDCAPVRIEFFDEEVDSIRIFDLETQKSSDTITEAFVFPVQEYVIGTEEQQELKWEIKDKARRAVGRLQRLGKKEAVKRLHRKVDYLEERLEQGIMDENSYPFLSLLPIKFVSLLDWFKDNALIILDEPLRIKEQLDFQNSQRQEEYTANLEKGEEFVEPEKIFLQFEDIANSYREKMIIGMANLFREIPGFLPRKVHNINARLIAHFNKTSMLVEEIKKMIAVGDTIALFAGNRDQAQRLTQGLKDSGIESRIRELEDEVAEKAVNIYPLALDQGFEIPGSKTAIFTESEIFRKEVRRQVKVQKQKKDDLLLFADLKPGDFVVHLYHGIGKFIGIEKIAVEGIEKDYFAIKYAGEDKLYVPLDQIQLLQKYLGADGDREPKLNKLNGSEWNKAKSRARSAVKEMAIDLIELYAKRESSKGYAFSADNHWQKEFEDKFPYEETGDQLQSVQEIKNDMMKTKAMDRLLCGDVGYGKTEVAMRAAFKAVNDGKQVAVLVPTTILAQQHFTTFKERFIDYPVKIDMISRFRTPKEQKQIMEALKNGVIDIIIGTHKLVSEGVDFKDLGLLIVDEEQRFGVAHKEKIKALKTNIDVLTLSATPIPRTLHMSLVGLRDMSVISTPPENRYPVQTFVAEFNPDMVREAIRREVQRGGQVFYVHNRIESLSRVLEMLNSLVPEARCGVVHGQMNENQLENEMISFLEKEKDILICTTIIETGMDMANVNTLIVDEADRFGLSQLYQLKGRVGRSNRKAYAYFLYQPSKILTEEAEKRLSTIREFTEFGSGFKVAMRDLEIRGAGNLVGGEQHGHLAAVGFNLYVRLLKEAIKELRGEEPEEQMEPSIDIQIKALLPDEYIVDKQAKASLYQRMIGIAGEEEMSEMFDELVDRFGTPPPEVENLMEIVKIRYRSKALKIDHVVQNKQEVTIRFAKDPGLTGSELMELASNYPYPLSFAAAEKGNLELKVRLRTVFKDDIPKVILKLFDMLEQCMKSRHNEAQLLKR